MTQPLEALSSIAQIQERVVGSCTSALRIKPQAHRSVSQEQKGLEARALMASQRLSHPW